MIIRRYVFVLAVLAGMLLVPLFAQAAGLAYTDAKVPDNLSPVARTGSGVYYPSGTYFFSETDLNISAKGFPIVWDRHYRSNRVIKNDSGEWSFAAPANGPMGYGWHNTWLCRIEGDAFKTANGIYIYFSKDANGNYIANTGAGFTLVKTSSGYELKERRGFTYVFDATGKLTAIRDTAGNSATLQYDGSGNLSLIKDLTGRQVLSFSHNADGRIASVTDLSGRIVTYDYDSQGNLTQVSYNSTTAATYAYNANHGITTKTNAVGDSYTILYTPKWETKGVVQKITDPVSNSASFSYDFGNRIYNHKDYNGTTYKYYLNADGKLLQTEETGSDGNKIVLKKISYPSNRLTKITDALGNSVQLQSDDWGNVIKRTDEEGNDWLYGYDSQSHLTSETNPLGIQTRYEYDANGNRTKETQAAGTTDESVITYTYSSFKELLSKSNNGETTTYEYDSAGNQIKITDPEGGVTAMAYDAVGNLTSLTVPLMGTTTFENHDFRGNSGKITDLNGVVTNNTYDQQGRLKTTTNTSDNSTTQYFYTSAGSGCSTCGSGGAGKLSAVILPEGNRIDYAYDTAGKLSKITDNAGNSINYTYDGHGNRTREEIRDITGTLQKTVNHGYDLLNRHTLIVNPDGGRYTATYDKRGNWTNVTDPNTNTTGLSYDQANRLTSIIQPGGVTTVGTYDSRNNLISVTDAIGNTTRYEYDKQSRRIKTISPDSGTATYTYDKNGNIKTMTDAKGITATYTYDQANRPTGVTFPDPKDNISYAYDTCPNGKSRLCQMTDPSGTTAYEYTPKGELAKETKVIDGRTFVTEYGYDKNCNITTIKYPSGRGVTYQYASDRIAQILNNGVALAYNIAYKPFGNVSALTFGNGIQQTNSYDQQYRINKLIAQGLQDLSYAYDKNGNITAITDNLDATKNKTYGYDQLNRLVNAQGLWGNLAYTYDGTGNRKSETTQSGVTTYSHTNNRLITATGAKSYTFGYDVNGNTTSENTRNYIYNQDQQLIQVTEKTGETEITSGEYLYDGKGQRVKKTAGNATTYFIFDQQGKLIEETGASTSDYIFLNETPITKVDGQTTYYIHTDHLATPRKMTDSQKQITWEMNSMPFGETISISGSSTNNFRFPGQYYDAKSGLNYNYYRDYNPNIGRYAESDPMGLLRELNLYSYVQNNPVNKIDPSGLYGKDVHYDETRYLAVMAGFNLNDATEIASADQSVDDDWISNPFNYPGGTKLHFMSETEARQLVRNTIESCNLGAFGVALHIFQDTYSHAGFSWKFGHIFAGTAPDKFSYNSTRDMDMVNNTKYYLYKFKEKCKCKK